MLLMDKPTVRGGDLLLARQLSNGLCSMSNPSTPSVLSHDLRLLDDLVLRYRYTL